MKTSKLVGVFVTATMLTACVSDPTEVDKNLPDSKPEHESLESLLTRSEAVEAVDSITMIGRSQSDVDNLMMSRIVLRDSTYVLSINREAANYLGVSDEIYDKYLDYIEELNTKSEEE